MGPRSSRARALALAAVLATALGSCGMFARSAPRGDAGKEVQFGEELETESPGKRSRETTTRRPERQTIRKSITVTEIAPPSGGSSRMDDDGPVGGMALAYLRDEIARSLVVEIDYVEGKRPADTAIAHLQSVLGREVDKPGGIRFLVDDKIPASRSSWNGGDIEDLERRYRDRHSGGDTATVWIVYLNGRFEDGSGALGVAFRASRIALFKDRIADAAIPTVPASRVERSVIVHEVGHVLSLVNLGWESPRDHEDPAHAGHSRNRASVMFWAVETVSVNSILQGGPPEGFDADDRDDLRRRRDDL